MSCCGGCQSGMGYCDSSGLSGLYGLDGLYGLMGELVAAGSVVRVGFAFEMANTDYGLQSEGQGFQNVANALRQHLQELGVFSSVNVAVKPPQYFNFQDGYITVQVTTADGQSDPRNVGDMVQYKLSDYTLGVIVTKRDDEKIDYVPPEAVGKPGVAQVTQTQQQQQSSLPSPQGQSRCDWNTMRWYDYAACQFGITSPIGGIGAGAAGALVVIGVGTLLAVVLLKR